MNHGGMKIFKATTFGQDCRWQGVDRRNRTTHLSPSHRVHGVSSLSALLLQENRESDMHQCDMHHM